MESSIKPDRVPDHSKNHDAPTSEPRPSPQDPSAAADLKEHDIESRIIPNDVPDIDEQQIPELERDTPQHDDVSMDDDQPTSQIQTLAASKTSHRAPEWLPVGRILLKISRRYGPQFQLLVDRYGFIATLELLNRAKTSLQQRNLSLDVMFSRSLHFDAYILSQSYLAVAQKFGHDTAVRLALKNHQKLVFLYRWTAVKRRLESRWKVQKFDPHPIFVEACFKDPVFLRGRKKVVEALLPGWVLMKLAEGPYMGWATMNGILLGRLFAELQTGLKLLMTEESAVNGMYMCILREPKIFECDPKEIRNRIETLRQSMGDAAADFILSRPAVLWRDDHFDYLRTIRQWRSWISVLFSKDSPVSYALMGDVDALMHPKFDKLIKRMEFMATFETVRMKKWTKVFEQMGDKRFEDRHPGYKKWHSIIYEGVQDEALEQRIAERFQSVIDNVSVLCFVDSHPIFHQAIYLPPRKVVDAMKSIRRYFPSDLLTSVQSHSVVKDLLNLSAQKIQISCKKFCSKASLDRKTAKAVLMRHPKAMASDEALNELISKVVVFKKIAGNLSPVSNLAFHLYQREAKDLWSRYLFLERKGIEPKPRWFLSRLKHFCKFAKCPISEFEKFLSGGGF